MLECDKLLKLNSAFFIRKMLADFIDSLYRFFYFSVLHATEHSSKEVTNVDSIILICIVAFELIFPEFGSNVLFDVAAIYVGQILLILK
jgi:hypothetical protein